MYELIDGKVTFVLEPNLSIDLNSGCDKKEIKFDNYKYVVHQKMYHCTIFGDSCCPKCDVVIFIGNINSSVSFYCDCAVIGKVTIEYILVREEI